MSKKSYFCVRGFTLRKEMLFVRWNSTRQKLKLAKIGVYSATSCAARLFCYFQ